MQSDGQDPHSSGSEPAGSWVILQAGSARLGIEASQVEAITDPPRTTPLPRAPDYLLGLANLRGEALPLMSLSAFLELAERADGSEPEVSETRRVLVVRCGELYVGLRCERIIGLRRVDSSAVRESGLVRGGRIQEFTQAEVDLDDGLVALLDAAALLEAARVRA